MQGKFHQREKKARLSGGFAGNGRNFVRAVLWRGVFSGDGKGWRGNIWGGGDDNSYWLVRFFCVCVGTGRVEKGVCMAPFFCVCGWGRGFRRVTPKRARLHNETEQQNKKQSTPNPPQGIRSTGGTLAKIDHSARWSFKTLVVSCFSGSLLFHFHVTDLNDLLALGHGKPGDAGGIVRQLPLPRHWANRGYRLCRPLP